MYVSRVFPLSNDKCLNQVKQQDLVSQTQWRKPKFGFRDLAFFRLTCWVTVSVWRIRRLGKKSSIIYAPIDMILSVFLNTIYRSFLASIAFACQKSQSFQTKMPLAQRKMCLEWSPGDQDGRFLRMAEASRPWAIHGVIRSSSNHIPRRCSNQHSGPTGSFRNHHAQVRQKSCKPRLHQTLESNEDLYMALIPAAKTQFHQKSASDGLSQSHSLVQKAKAAR